jgi:hypothetical protein
MQGMACPPPAHITRQSAACAQCTRHAPRHVTLHDCTPLHCTSERSPTLGAQFAMFEHETWQPLPQFGSQTLAPLQSTVHDEPQVPVHATPFWHCTMQLLAVFPPPWQVKTALDDAVVVVPEELVADAETDVVEAVDVVEATVSVATVVALAVVLVLVLVAPPVFVMVPDPDVPPEPASGYAPQSNVLPPHPIGAAAIKQSRQRERIVFSVARRDAASIRPQQSAAGTRPVPIGSKDEAGRRDRDDGRAGGRRALRRYLDRRTYHCMLRAMIRPASPSWLSLSFVLAAYSGIGVVACATTAGQPMGEFQQSGSQSTDVGSMGDSGFGTLGNGDSGPIGNLAQDATTQSSGDGCQHSSQVFLPKIPIVYVLADRSGSEFSSPDAGAWFPLQTATLAVIQSLQAEVAFGFGAYTGINPNTTAGMCPILDEVPIALNNYAAINTKYTSLGQPMFKAETPATLSLQKVSQEVAQATLDPSAGQVGERFILFVTDSETDFCDDGAAICPADSVTATIQNIYKQGIQTLILGMTDKSNPSQIAAQALQAFANAGAGLPPVAPPLNPGQPPALPLDIYNQCNPVNGWKAQYTGSTANNQGTSLATYAAPDASTMNATVYSPATSGDVTSLTNAIATALQTVKSCSFDLQGQVQIDATLAAEGTVTIDGTVVPFDANNGWTLSGSTTIELVGSACDNWRSKGKDISFDFPCAAIIPR